MTTALLRRNVSRIMRLKIAKILPLAFAETLRQILCAERNDPERLSNLYLRFGSILRRIREKKRLTIQGLSVLSGVRALNSGTEPLLNVSRGVAFFIGKR
jgi:ribosomal protein S19E (S16A)